MSGDRERPWSAAGDIIIAYVPAWYVVQLLAGRWLAHCYYYQTVKEHPDTPSWSYLTSLDFQTGSLRSQHTVSNWRHCEKSVNTHSQLWHCCNLSDGNRYNHLHKPQLLTPFILNLTQRYTSSHVNNSMISTKETPAATSQEWKVIEVIVKPKMEVVFRY